MANVLSQKWVLNRRHFLTGLGVSMALPMLQCMRPLRAAEAPAQPRRNVFIYLPNRVNTYDYQLEEEVSDYKLSTILAPLEPHRSQFSPISGLYHSNAFGVVHDATRTSLTGAKHGPSVVFKDLFAEPSGEVERQRRDLQRKQSVMGLIWDDAMSLSSALDGADRDRLDQYLTDPDGVNNSDFGPRNRNYQAVPNP